MIVYMDFLGCLYTVEILPHLTWREFGMAVQQPVSYVDLKQMVRLVAQCHADGES